MRLIGKTQAEVDAETTRRALGTERAELQAQLDTYDLKTVRPLRAITAGTGTAADADKVAEIEAQVATIRARIAEISKQLGGL